MSEKRIYNTRQSDEILKIIDSFGEAHFTANDVAVRLGEEGIRVGQATVYRRIDRLAEMGKLRKYVLDGSTAACYQRVVTESAKHCHEHFHLKCEGCGELIHVECRELSKIAEHMENDHGFRIDNTKTVFYGRCKRCRE